MARSQPPDPVKLVVAALWADSGALAAATERTVSLWGEIDYSGADHPFDVTEYYRDEMGTNLYRRLLAFERLVAPGTLVALKLATNAIEDVLRGPDGDRRVNLDIGYLDHHKLVLASTKPAGQKVYLGEGVYADLLFRYSAGRLLSFDWTFPDFRDGRYEEELLEIRLRYLRQLRNRSGSASL